LGADLHIRSLPRAGDGVYWVVPGGAGNHIERMGRIVRLPQHSGFYHPDLIWASDAVVGKVGYSTLAETFHAGLPFGYVVREGFRESPVLTTFIDECMSGIRITLSQLEDGSWAETLTDLLEMKRSYGTGPNGADQAAAFIVDALGTR
jgi:hypothetical protein